MSIVYHRPPTDCYARSVRLADPESLIIAALGIVLLFVSLVGPLLFGLPPWSRMAAVLGFGFLVYGVAGLRRRDEPD